MFIYILYAILFLVMLFIYKENNKIFIPIILLLALNAFRGYSVGTDYKYYLDFYKANSYAFVFDDLNIITFIKSIGLDKANELGWTFMNYLGDKYKLPFYFINFFAISLILYFINGMIRKQSPHFFFSLYLYLMLAFFFPSFNIIRHALAIAIFAYSIRYINENKPITYVFFCLLASLFHTSALLLFVLYFLKYLKINTVYCLILFLFSIIIPLINLDTLILSFFHDTNTLSLYSIYTEKGIDLLNDMGHFAKIAILIVQTLIFLYFSLRLKGSKNIYMNLWFIGIFLQNITMNYDWLFRFSGYFLIAQIIALPQIVYSSNLNLKQKNTSFYVIIGYSLIIYFYRLYTGSEGIIPYTTL